MTMKRLGAAIAVLSLAIPGAASAEPFKILKCTVVRAANVPPSEAVRVGDAQLLMVGRSLWKYWDEYRKKWGGNWCTQVDPAVAANPVASCRSSPVIEVLTRNWVHATPPVSAEDDLNQATGQWEEIGHGTGPDHALVTFRIARRCVRAVDPATSGFGWFSVPGD